MARSMLASENLTKDEKSGSSIFVTVHQVSACANSMRMAFWLVLELPVELLLVRLEVEVGSRFGAFDGDFWDFRMCFL